MLGSVGFNEEMSLKTHKKFRAILRMYRLRECNALEPGFGSLVIYMGARIFPKFGKYASTECYS